MIRGELPDDYAAIDEINREAFGEDAEAKLVAAIRQAEGFDPTLSRVALHDDRVIGHILFSPIRIESDQANTPALALAPMAVLPAFQRLGIGSAMVRDGLDTCRSLGHAIVIVVGHPEFYPRFGFRPAGPHGIRSPFPGAEEAFMALELVPGVLDGIRGVARYPAAFDDA